MGYDLNAKVHQRVPSLEELSNVFYFDVDHGLAQDLWMQRLHVDSLVAKI